ncbi:TPA: hypothetical protein TUN88_001067 [Streptococcus equi subsp. zooepidemicus]|nr:hypothetical protein [Streptococcus equi subsp. zooepidemicus]
MVERAYSVEFERELDAKKANQYSITGSLKSEKAFKCIDPNCEIPLTCTNWRKKDGKRHYFRPSHNDEPHVEGCTCITPQEIREHVNKEVLEAKNAIIQSGVISVKKSISKTKIVSVLNVVTPIRGGAINNGVKGNEVSDKIQERQLSSLATFVELFNDEEIDNDAQLLRIDGELISLNNYFVDVVNNPVKDKNRIFFGEANISKASFGEDMLEIEFLNSDYPKIYSNIKQIQERANTRNIANLIGNGPVTIYFRGLFHSKDNKFKSFNDKFYKDLYSPEN